MSNKSQLPELTVMKNPLVGYHFQVSVLINGGNPDPIDIRFQKVSGIKARVDTAELIEGGENLFAHSLPRGVRYDNLILERGMVIGSRLSSDFNVPMRLFKFTPSDVLVSLLDENSFPIANWLFMEAFPVQWSISDLDANGNTVVIESMELKYTRFQNVSI